MGQMRFEFGSEQERDEFLVLNDLQLSRDGEIVDHERHVVGRLVDPLSVEIREGSHHGLRTEEWFLADDPPPGPGPAPEQAEEQAVEEQASLTVIRSAQTRLSALLLRAR
jgi:hypothetical protein